MPATLRTIRDAVTRPVSISRTLVAVALALVVVAYAMQMATPLRINSDVVANLNKAMHAVGDTRLPMGYPEQKRPGGYPTLVAWLDGVGLAHSWALVGLNVLCALVSALCAASFSRTAFRLSRGAAALVAVASLLNWTWIKFVTLPLPEHSCVMLCWLTMAALAASLRRRGAAAALLVCAAAASAGLAIWFRTAAILLIAPVVWCVHLHRVRALPLHSPFTRRQTIATAAAIVLVTGVVALTMSLDGYLWELSDQLLGAKSPGVLGLASARTSELGSVAANYPGPRRSLAMALPGVLAGLLLVRALVRRRRRHPEHQLALALLAGHVGVLGVWYYCDPRFLLPVVPLFAMIAIAELRLPTRATWIRHSARGWALAYAGLGIVALGHSTLLSFSGPTFPSRFGGGALVRAYESAGRSPLPDDLTEPETRAAHVLGHFNHAE